MGRRLFAATVTVLFFYILSPLLLPVTMGAVLAVLFYPWLERLEKRGIPKGFGSAILTFGITVVLIFPSSLLVSIIARIGFEQLGQWKKVPGSSLNLMGTFLDFPQVHSLMVWITRFFPVSMQELEGSFQIFLNSVGARLAELLGYVLSHLPNTLMALALVVVSVYYFLVDGKKWVEFVKINSVFNKKQTSQIFKKLSDVCRSVILAALIAGFIQAVIEGFACVVTGTPHFVLIAFMIFVGSFVPLVGASPIALIVALHQLSEGRQIAAILLLITVFILITVDNTIRPIFLKGTANLHPLLGFVAALGGLQTLGFSGIFLGPILAALFVATVQVMVEQPD